MVLGFRGDECMLIERVNIDPEIYRIVVPLRGFAAGDANVYVVKHAGEALIVDAGLHTDECWRLLQEAFESLKIDLHKTRLFITHAHMDHAGCVPYMMSAAVPCIMGAAELESARAFALAARDACLEELWAVGVDREISSMIKRQSYTWAS